ncbi:MAG: tetraacyldisaccharide 4'-kinase [Desulfobacter sp.]|nr:tetraacyldisaccharide 4'-kinase [Desulfobacter sp.]WDP85517.1 MAG: tetraacyldisaccharide 4'-kinase [Desulfobacter sp.]
MMNHRLAALEKKITRISGQDYEPKWFSFEQMLVFFSKLYEVGTRLRLNLYKTGRLQQKRLPCTVISVGNIMAGGAGKTPMAVCLADILTKMGRKPVVVSRGYGGGLKKAAGIVGDGQRVFMDARTAGDEPYMMAQMKAFPVVVGKDRYDAGCLALAQLDVDIVILDDGFGHLGLARDLNLVLFDHDRPLGNNRILPAGRLRETPAMSKQRIHGLILTRCPEQGGDTSIPDVLEELLGKIPFFCTCHSPYLSMFYPRKKAKISGPCSLPEDITALKGKKAFLFSGIARNDSFRKTVAQLGVKVVDHLEFKDHYRYKRADFETIGDRAKTAGADLILTTEKDWAKVDPSFVWKKDLAVINIRIQFEQARAFKAFLESRLSKDE